MNRLVTLVRGGAALVILLGLLLGVPVLLVTTVGNPYPPEGLVGGRLTDNAILGLLAVIGWITWAQLVGCVSFEVTAEIRSAVESSMRPQPLPGTFIAQRRLAHVLVQAVVAAVLGAGISAPAAGPTAAPPMEPAVSSPPQRQATTAVPQAEIVVTKGDTLWSLAEHHLGSGERWREIAALNRGRDVGDGVVFAHAETIEPGWRLLVPRPSSDTVIVRPGDTLWGLAEHEYGDGRRWPELYDANRDQIENPALIFPGQALRVPSAEPSQPAAAPSPAPATRPVPEALQPAELPAAAPKEAAPADASSLLPAITGGGMLFGASLLSLFLYRRRMQYRVRRPGRTVSATPARLVPVEATIRVEGGDGLDATTFLDKATRGLVVALRQRDGQATLPDVIAARLGDEQLELHLRSPYPGRVPLPWREDETGLVLSLSRAEVLAESDSLAPYPTLVAIGADEAGGTWLLDLESAGIVHVEGDPAVVQEVGLFLVAELGVNVWSDHVAVGVDEFPESLTRLNPERIQLVGPEPVQSLVASVRNVVDSTHVTGQDVLTGRLDGGAGEAWMPLVVVLTADLDLDAQQLSLLRQELDHPPGRKATALVVLGERQLDAAALRLSADADGWLTVEPLGIKVKANRLSDEGASRIAELFTHHRDVPDEPIPPAAGAKVFEEISDAAGALLEPTLKRQDAERMLALDPSLDADLADWHHPGCARPRIRMLGPVELMVAEEPTGDAQVRRAIVTELVAYLATRAHGATSEQIACDFDLQENAVHNRMRDTRKWIGVEHLPECTKTDEARKRGMGVYQVVDVLSDEDLFRRLRVRAQARGDEGIQDLVDALRLVEGRPFDQLRRRGYAWLADTPLDHHLTAGILDVAQVVAARFEDAGDAETARWAEEVASGATGA